MRPPSPPIDAIAVLGAQVMASGAAGPAIRRRLMHGVALWRDGRARYLLLSGGGGGGLPAEAAVMADLARAAGVSEACLVIEDASRNTFENAVYCHRIMRRRGWRRLIVVTDGFHLTRALYVFRRLGIDVEGAGVRRPDDVSRVYWYAAHVEDAARLVRSAALFAIGTHKAVVARLREQ